MRGQIRLAKRDGDRTSSRLCDVPQACPRALPPCLSLGRRHHHHGVPGRWSGEGGHGSGAHARQGRPEGLPDRGLHRAGPTGPPALRHRSRAGDAGLPRTSEPQGAGRRRSTARPSLAGRTPTHRLQGNRKGLRSARRGCLPLLFGPWLQVIVPCQDPIIRAARLPRRLLPRNRATRRERATRWMRSLPSSSRRSRA
jgi:hypothetical protein